MKKPPEKVAVLRIPAEAWEVLTPQQQMLHIMQQMMGFMASEFFADMEGIQVQVIDPQHIANCKVVFQVGKPPQTSSIISVN